MQIAVLGAGSLGSLFGGLLSLAGANVTLLGRDDAHLAAVRENGLTVEAPDGSAQVADVTTATDPAAVADVDLLLVCVKSYDTDDALADVAPHLDDVGDILTLQNGLGNAETIAQYAPMDWVIAGTTSHGATREAPGLVRHAGRGDTRIGRYFAANDEHVQEIASLFTEAGIETEVVADVRDAIWAKVLVNAGINAATALARVPNGALVEEPAGERVLERAVREGEAVAQAVGRDLSHDPVAETRTVARRTATNRSSMRQDVEAGRRTEVEAVNGALVERAEEHGINVPVNRTLTDLVRLAESEEEKGNQSEASGSDGRGQS